MLGHGPPAPAGVPILQRSFPLFDPGFLAPVLDACGGSVSLAQFYLTAPHVALLEYGISPSLPAILARVSADSAPPPPPPIPELTDDTLSALLLAYPLVLPHEVRALHAHLAQAAPERRGLEDAVKGRHCDRAVDAVQRKCAYGVSPAAARAALQAHLWDVDATVAALASTKSEEKAEEKVQAQVHSAAPGARPAGASAPDEPPKPDRLEVSVERPAAAGGETSLLLRVHTSSPFPPGTEAVVLTAGPLNAHRVVARAALSASSLRGASATRIPLPSRVRCDLYLRLSPAGGAPALVSDILSVTSARLAPPPRADHGAPLRVEYAPDPLAPDDAPFIGMYAHTATDARQYLAYAYLPRGGGGAEFRGSTDVPVCFALVGEGYEVIGAVSGAMQIGPLYSASARWVAPGEVMVRCKVVQGVQPSSAWAEVWDGRRVAYEWVPPESEAFVRIRAEGARAAAEVRVYADKSADHWCARVPIEEGERGRAK